MVHCVVKRVQNFCVEQHVHHYALDRIMRGIDKVNMEHFFEFDHCGGHDLRDHRFKVKVERSRLQLRQGFFSQRVVGAWNSLPSSVVEASSVNNFKKRLDDWSQDVDFFLIHYIYKLQVTRSGRPYLKLTLTEADRRYALDTSTCKSLSHV